MIGQFAFSYDRQTFHGEHDTRQDAYKAALEKLPQQQIQPEAIYVGKRVPVEPGSSGLAETVLAAMRRRFRDQTGQYDSQYLIRVNEHQLAELDDEIDRVIRAWLTRHNLQPAEGKIVAISEHPVPLSKMTADRGGSGEVGGLGEGDYPIFLA